MSISDLYDSGFRKRNTDHFASIVRVAMSDGIITDSEKTFLDRLARNLNVTENDYEKILKDYNSYPINPPVSYDNRLERLFDLTRMVWADGVKGEAQESLLHKFCVGLGFHAVNVKYIADKALELVKNEATLEEFSYGIKNMNQ
ncbi:TerB family tellurite resistance protein [Winogradskyella endarachnes]|uniref:TerB family tellurite resistance protein n=1 Tax=Winogradskyella endarachnes TaxID=2681965 RepID=A0A6L6UEN3_9FLAO|nr:TerB family tellurite resistance protein [Winogradskyella endarachnes]MUU79402.1 TerB family tellurite resistance protein [Winogradskyella endarachnes]